MIFGKNLTFAQLTNQKNFTVIFNNHRPIYYVTSSYQLLTSASYSNISFMPHRRNSITIATTESQRPSFSAMDPSTDTDRGHSVMPPLQSTPPPAHIWVDHNRQLHPFIEEGGKW